MSLSLTLTSNEYSVLAHLVGSRQAQPLGPAARESALESLRTRRILRHDGSVDVRVAILFAVLMRPLYRITITRFGSQEPTAVIAGQRLTDVVVEFGGSSRRLTPTDDGVSHALGSIRGARGEAFSLSGRTWRDLVLQSPYATIDQLSRLAQLDGSSETTSERAAHIASAHASRCDAQVLTFRGRRTWLGLELSWVDWGEGSWLIDDGGRFGRSEDLNSRRVTLTPAEPARAIRRLLHQESVD